MLERIFQPLMICNPLVDLGGFEIHIIGNGITNPDKISIGLQIQWNKDL